LEQGPGDGAAVVALSAQVGGSDRSLTARGQRPSTRWYGQVGGKTPEERSPDVAAG